MRQTNVPKDGSVISWTKVRILTHTGMGPDSQHLSRSRHHSNSLRFKFHVSPAAKTTEIRRKIENVLGTRPSSESVHRDLLLGMINEIPIHEHAPKDDHLLLLTADKNSAFFTKFNPVYFVCVGLGDEETLDF